MAYDADYLNETVKTDPQGTETKSLGDDSIREIKRVLQNMFPTVFLTPNDSYSGTLAQLSELATTQILPRNTIVMWAPTDQEEVNLPNGPVGWTICDGRARKDGGGGVAPDMTNRFILGAKSIVDVGAGHGDVNNTGVYKGNNELQAWVGGNFGTTLASYQTSNTTLKVEQLPRHGHFTTKDGGSSTDLGDGGAVYIAGNSTGVGNDNSYSLKGFASGTDVGQSSQEGGGGPHAHSFNLFTTGTYCNISAYYSALYIIKD
jgi:hypothetical protein